MLPQGPTLSHIQENKIFCHGCRDFKLYIPLTKIALFERELYEFEDAVQPMDLFGTFYFAIFHLQRIVSLSI